MQIRPDTAVEQEKRAKRPAILPSRVSRTERDDLEHTGLAAWRAFTGAVGGALEIAVQPGNP